MIVGTGQGKGLYGAVWVGVSERPNEGPQGGAGGKDVVDQEEGGGRGGIVGIRYEGGAVSAWCGGGNLIDFLDLESALPAGQVFVREGLAGLVEERGEVAAAEASGQGMAKEVEGGGEVRAGGHFIVVEGADNNGVGGKGLDAEQLGRTVDPGVEVGLDALFEFEQAKGKGIFSGCQREIRTEVEVGEGSIPAFYFGCQQPHDHNALGQNYKRSGAEGRMLRAVMSIRIRVEFAGLVALTILALLPDKYSCPGQRAGYQPPGGLQDQEKEDNPCQER